MRYGNSIVMSAAAALVCLLAWSKRRGVDRQRGKMIGQEEEEEEAEEAEEAEEVDVEEADEEVEDDAGAETSLSGRCIGGVGGCEASGRNTHQEETYEEEESSNQRMGATPALDNAASYDAHMESVRRRLEAEAERFLSRSNNGSSGGGGGASACARARDEALLDSYIRASPGLSTAMPREAMRQPVRGAPRLVQESLSSLGERVRRAAGGKRADGFELAPVYEF